MNLYDPALTPGPVRCTSNVKFFKLIGMNTTLLIGVGFILVAALLALRTHLWLAKAQFTEGEVVQMIATRSKKSMVYKPRVRYTTMDGQQREFVRGYSSSPPDFTVGEKVIVGHNPQTGEGRIVAFGQRFGLAWVLAWFGISLATLSIGFAIGRQIVPRIYLHGQ
jgi:hypothetical protein